ncbi:polyketide synthase dehydratase domain-containing protein [Actinokineospora sp. PR83]|uniref:beta-ketoacyl synthase N-terminal-like domain-containing protein n=1 Tax=Actinokineospora sp. PR83 TaxID=2884908 RepID=UPI001F3BDE7E|nr:beta-ketoacyl synthase N-terminal-like domain-containing protein [Actinokineospora sp. PR83]MCG8915261.1 polyketide synthase dehydratase domain-containing protein [Actinokineospora sp. PR83]
MPVHLRPDDYEALLSHSLETIKKLTAQAEDAQRTREPVAIIGMGCRLPGGSTTPEAFWEFLRAGGDGAVEVPADRWSIDELYDPSGDVPGTVYVREAGFLTEDVGAFDPHFFGISPREAMEMDPQQRLALEVCWEALERAGIAPDRIRGSRTGVFFGQIGSEYANLPRERKHGNPYTLTGTMSNITSGRISYVLGLTGPSISIDTACSSSLVAVHLACESLLRGESETALAGGVNLLLTPEGFTSLCDMGALSRDGRCKSFDEGGDGYGRGEGCGVVLLKRLSDAQRDGDPVLAVVRGTGVNQDGGGSGLTVPNGSAQRALIRRTLEEAEVAPADIGYFEAHGTGTALGDPIEFQALVDVFGGDPDREAPLHLGSVKSNIGHLEAAAGIAGLIKLVLCLRNREIPPSLHLDNVNPKIRLAAVPAVVPKAVVPWESADRPRTAAISSFGFSGTNAHAIVAEAPPGPAPRGLPAGVPTADRPVHVLALSARSTGALRDLAATYERLLLSADAPRLGDVCHTAGAGRSHFAHRLAFVAADAAGMARRIAEHARDAFGAPDGGAVAARRSAPKLAFVLGGASDLRQALLLRDTQPAFRDAVDECETALIELTGRGVVDGWSTGAAPTEVDQFCVQHGLLSMWASWGVRPRAVLAAGAAELAAACSAGVLHVRAALELLTGVVPIPDGSHLTAPRLRLVSAATGGPVSRAEALSAEHWAGVRTARPLLDQAVDALLGQGCDAYLALAPGDAATAVAARVRAATGHLLPPPSPEDLWHGLATAVAELYEAGVDVDWAGFDAGPPRTRVVLPTYPFQRKRYWTETADRTAPAQVGPVPPRAGIDADRGDPLDGRVVLSPVSTRQIEFVLPLDAVPDVRATHGVLHTGYYLEMLSRAARQVLDSAVEVEDLLFTSALVLREDRENRIVLTLDRLPQGDVAFAFHLRAADGEWTGHANGRARLVPAGAARSGDRTRPLDARGRALVERSTGVEFYRYMADTKRIALGEGVQWVAEVRTGPGEALGRLTPPTSVGAGAPFGLGVHPGALDACAQLFHAALPGTVETDVRFMVTRWRDITWSGEGIAPDELWCHATVTGYDRRAGELKGGFELLDGDGRVLVSVADGVMKGISARTEEAFRELAMGPSEQSGTVAASQVVRSLSEAPEEQRHALLEDYLRACFADLLKIDVDELDVGESLAELGLDSLVGVTAKKIIEDELRVSLAIETLIEGPSVRELTEAVLGRVELVPAEPRRSATGRADNSRWFGHRKRNPAAEVKLFCLPYGRGRGASVFRGWQQLLPDAVEVCPIQLPGKETRIKERSFEHIDTAIDALTEAVLPELDRPYAFYGHSAGGLLAYRLAHRLWEVADRKPRHLFIGAYSAPPVHPNPMIALTRNLFREIGLDDIPSPDELASASPELREAILGVITSEADLSDELARVLLPSRLAELKLVQSYRPDGSRFDVPITAFHGLRDDRVDEAHMKAWSEVTDGEFTLHLLSGDHLFLREDQDQRLLLHHIARGLGW